MKITLNKTDIEKAIRQYLRLYFYDEDDETKMKAEIKFFDHNIITEEIIAEIDMTEDEWGLTQEFKYTKILEL